MGSKPPVLTAKQGIAILENLNFVEVPQRGAHKQFRRSGGRAATVPVQGGRDISPMLLRQIAKDSGLTVAELLSHRKR